MRYLPDRLLVEWSRDKYPGGIPKNFPSKVQAAFFALNHGLFENKVKRCSVVVDNIEEEPGIGTAGYATFQKTPFHSQTTIEVNGKLFHFADSESVTITVNGGDVNSFAGKPDQNSNLYKIALNFRLMEATGFMRILSTLAHEMCHVYEFIYAGYLTDHSPYWANLMSSIGLPPEVRPNNTPCKKGIGLGDRVSHTIDEHGAFKRIARQLIGEYSFERD